MTEPTPEVPAEVYRAAEAAYDLNVCVDWVDPYVAVRAVAARVWPLAYTAGRDSIHTEWAHSLTSDLKPDDEETLRVRSRELARRLVEPEIRAEVAAEMRAAFIAGAQIPEWAVVGTVPIASRIAEWAAGIAEGSGG